MRKRGRGTTRESWGVSALRSHVGADQVSVVAGLPEQLVAQRLVDPDPVALALAGVGG